MSILKKNIWTIIVFVAVALMTLSLAAQEETNEILNHYQLRASEVFDGRNPLLSGLNFSFEATTYYKKYDKNEIPIIVDSTIAVHYYSYENIDSIVVQVAPQNIIDSLDIRYPNVFLGEYRYNFYPNDTGGQELAIGYDSKEFNPDVPVGVALIDRDWYFLTRLYMYYMNERRDRRASKIFRFTEFEGFIFPDSVWEIKAKSGIFSTEYYRIETGISDIKIYR